MKEMIQRDPSCVHLCDGVAKTPLHYAARSGSLKLVELLLDNCAKMSVVDMEGNTPVHVAAWSGHAE